MNALCQGIIAQDHAVQAVQNLIDNNRKIEKVVIITHRF